MIQQFVNNLSEKEKKIFYVAMAFVLLALLDRIFFGPVMAKLKTLDAEIEQQKNIIKRDIRFLAYEDHILKESETYQQYMPNVQQTEEEIIAAFLKNVENRATEAGINLVQVKPSESKNFKGYIEYYANLECDGPLEKVITFIHAIDSSPELLKVVKINMAPKRASAAEVTATMTVKKMIVDSSAVEDARRVVRGEISSLEAAEPETGQEDDGVGDAVGGGGFGGSSGAQSGSGVPGGPAGGDGDNVDWKPDQEAPPEGVANEGTFSNRYQMSGMKSEGKPETVESADLKKMDPVKPSVWEQLMQKHMRK